MNTISVFALNYIVTIISLYFRENIYLEISVFSNIFHSLVSASFD